MLADQFNVDRTPKDWLAIENDFHYRWNLPNCVGAVDGKHFAIRRPHNAGSLFYNYKGFHSVVLMAIADSHYRFVSIDVGAYGSEGDAGVFSTSAIGSEILNDNLQLPQNARVGSTDCPFYFVTDDAFPLKERLIKPYVPIKGKPLSDEERIFNYRLSRSRCCVENAFGILRARFQCFGRTMDCAPDRAQKIISACCHLHNYLMNISDSPYCLPNFADTYNAGGDLVQGHWRKVAPPLIPLQGRCGRTGDAAKKMRNSLKDYVNSPEGEEEWQRKAVFLD